MDHTPQVPADDRALRLLEHADLPGPTKQSVLALVRKAQDEATKAGRELQAEFGREHVALIVGCNQFLRVWRSGTEPGAVEVLLDPVDRQALQLEVATRPPEGKVFQLFGWVRADAEPAALASLERAVEASFRRALRTAK